MQQSSSQARRSFSASSGIVLADQSRDTSPTEHQRLRGYSEQEAVRTFDVCDKFLSLLSSSEVPASAWLVESAGSGLAPALRWLPGGALEAEVRASDIMQVKK
jgi:hypothetical protein